LFPQARHCPRTFARPTCKGGRNSGQQPQITSCVESVASLELSAPIRPKPWADRYGEKSQDEMKVVAEAQPDGKRVTDLVDPR
jgi:hypothetical protein